MWKYNTNRFTTQAGGPPSVAGAYTAVFKMFYLTWIIAAFALVLPVQAINLDHLTINGFLNFEILAEVDSRDTTSPDFYFKSDLFDLLFNFKVDDNMRATAELSWEHNSRMGEGIVTTDLGHAFIEHTFFDEFKLRIGKIQTPFGLFNELRRAKPAYLSVNVPASMVDPAALNCGARAFYPQAGVGISILGDFIFDYNKNLEYSLYVANGIQDSALNPFAADGNRFKAVTARLRFEVGGGFSLGKSFYLDKLVDKNYKWLFSDGYELQYTLGGFQLQAEGIIGTFKVTADSSLQQYGFYIQPSYGFDNGLVPYARFEYLSPPGEVINNYCLQSIFGIHYEINTWYMLKLEADYYYFGKNSLNRLQLGENSFTEIKSSLVLGF